MTSQINENTLDDINVEQPIFKYKLNQIIFYMRENKVHSGKVLGRRCIDYNEPWRATQSPELGENGIAYLTCHGFISQFEAFESKEALVNSL